MSTLHSRTLIPAFALVGMLALSACGSAPGSSVPTSSDAAASPDLDSLTPSPPVGPVVGVGTVMDVDGDVQLCLGAVAESYPPQCRGIPLDDWSWEGLDGSETSGTKRWGAYAVFGTYDGTRFVRTGEPIMLALYDPIAPADLTGGVEGKTADADLQRIQDELAAPSGANMLGLSIDQGYVWLDVVWDDGSLQQAADEDYGDDVVIVRSALRALGE